MISRQYFICTKCHIRIDNSTTTSFRLFTRTSWFRQNEQAMEDMVKSISEKNCIPIEDIAVTAFNRI